MSGWCIDDHIRPVATVSPQFPLPMRIPEIDSRDHIKGNRLGYTTLPSPGLRYVLIVYKTYIGYIPEIIRPEGDASMAGLEVIAGIITQIDVITMRLRTSR